MEVCLTGAPEADHRRDLLSLQTQRPGVLCRARKLLPGEPGLVVDVEID
jgi:hypothetical protein